MPSLPLKPKASRVALLYFGFFSAVMVPTLIGMLIGFFGPPTHILDQEELQAGWADKTIAVDGAEVETRIFATPEAARERARRYVDGTAKSHYVKTLNEHRFIDDEKGREVFVYPLDTVLIRVEGRDRQHVDQVLAQLPFLVENPRKNPMYVLLNEHLDWLFAGLAAYILFLTFALFRGGAWAATIEPPEHLEPVGATILRDRLLELNHLDIPIQIGESSRGRLVAEWRLADSRWREVFSQAGLKMASSLEMEIDEGSSTIRTIDISRALRWKAGLPRASFNLSYFRGISFYQAEAGSAFGLLRTPEGWRFDKAYQYDYSVNELKHPIMAAIIESGWTIRPVLTFFRPLGG